MNIWILLLVAVVLMALSAVAAVILTGAHIVSGWTGRPMWRRRHD